MATTVWSPQPALCNSFDVGMTSLTWISLPISQEDDGCPVDACWSSPDDVALSQSLAFNTSTSSHNDESDEVKSDAVEELPVQRLAPDDTWFTGSELMSYDDLDQCLSHLLMTSSGYRGSDNNVDVDWRTVTHCPLTDQLDTCFVTRATSRSSNDEERTTNTSQTVWSSVITCCASDTDEERRYKRTVHLWQFLKELLMCPTSYQNAIRWLDQHKGIFKIEDSAYVARLWGKRKNRPAMNYDKLSRSIRQYYRKGIIRKTDCSRRLVYQFCPKYL